MISGNVEQESLSRAMSNLSSQEALIHVRETLAELYPDEDNARIVVSDAQINEQRIDFSGSALEIWDHILREARKTDKVEDLFSVVLRPDQYGGNATLRAHIDAYRQAARSAGSAEVGTPPEPSTLEPRRRASAMRSRSWFRDIGLILGGLILLVLVITGVRNFTNGGTPLTPTPTAEGASVQAPTVTPTLTVQAATATPQPPPAFVGDYLFNLDWQVERVEYEFEPGILPSETITDFLTISRMAYGELDGSERAFDVRFALKNTSSQPIQLDLDKRFFSFEDDQGRKAELVYFCCNARGELLAPGATRTMQLIFRGVPGWEGKAVSAQALYLRVRGLTPIVRATWLIPPLATAN